MDAVTRRSTRQVDLNCSADQIEDGERFTDQEVVLFQHGYCCLARHNYWYVPASECFESVLYGYRIGSVTCKRSTRLQLRREVKEEYPAKQTLGCRRCVPPRTCRNRALEETKKDISSGSTISATVRDAMGD